MERDYHIDVDFVKYLKDLIYKKYPDSDDVSKIDYFLDRLNNNFKIPAKESYIERLRRDATSLRDFSSIYKIVKKFRNSGDEYSSVAIPKYREIDISNSDSLTIAHDFYSGLGNFFLDGVDDFYSDLNGSFEFISPNDNTSGEIHFFESTGDVFLIAPDNKDITKVSILIHELEHIIDCYNNPSFYKYFLIRETASMFMEMIGCDYLKKIFKLEHDDVLRRLNIYSITKIDSYFIYHKNQLLYLIDKYGELTNKELKHLLKDKYKFEGSFFRGASEKNIYEDYYYQISQLIAIELYEIYQQDKDKAIYILMDLVMNANDMNFMSFLNKYNIKLCNSIRTYEDDMYLKLGI